MKRNYKSVLALMLSVVLLFSISSIYVSAESATTESHTILTWSRDGGVVSEQYTINTLNTRAPRIKEAYRPSNLLSGLPQVDELTRGNITSQRSVNARQYPYCAVGYIEAYFDYDQDGSIADEEWVSTGTAFLEAEDIILTAAHCVYSIELGAWAQKVVFYPAKNAPTDSYSASHSAEAIHISISQNYVNGVDYTDWAICQLEDNLGDTFGWFGLSGEPVVGLDLTLSGYPGDDGYVEPGYQYRTLGEIENIVNSNFFWASNYSYHGYSGGPLYDANGTVFGICAVGGGSTPQEIDVGATSFPPWLFDMIIDACDASAARWD